MPRISPYEFPHIKLLRVQIIILFSIYAATISSAFGLLYALRTGKYHSAYVSAALATPICLFVAGYPGLYFVPVLFPIGILLGANFIKRQRLGLAILCFAPFLILWLCLLVIVLMNIAR